MGCLPFTLQMNETNAVKFGRMEKLFAEVLKRKGTDIYFVGNLVKFSGSGRHVKGYGSLGFGGGILYKKVGTRELGTIFPFGFLVCWDENMVRHGGFSGSSDKVVINNTTFPGQCQELSCARFALLFSGHSRV